MSSTLSCPKMSDVSMTFRVAQKNRKKNRGRNRPLLVELSHWFSQLAQSHEAARKQGLNRESFQRNDARSPLHLQYKEESSIGGESVGWDRERKKEGGRRNRGNSKENINTVDHSSFASDV